MNKILLVTKIGKNYGALLQAYALRQALARDGDNVSILRYELDITQQTYRTIPKITSLGSLKKVVLSLPRLFVTKESVKRCLRFRENYFHFTKPYRSFCELQQNPPTADILVTGSDQVWNPKISYDKAYYLQFGSTDALRCSYAASIGLAEIPEVQREDFIRRVKQVTFRSVRERSAKKLLESYGISSQVHLDPTLLLKAEDYDHIARTPDINEPYILLYLLKLPENYQNYIAALERLYPVHKIVSIPGNAFAPKIGHCEAGNIGPEDFVGLIRGADAVLTTSFHGTVFSIIYHKPFLSILPKGTGGRISDLLELLGLSSHIISDSKGLEMLFTPYQEEPVKQALCILREEA